jgi:hypothetical protein
LLCTKYIEQTARCQKLGNLRLFDGIAVIPGQPAGLNPESRAKRD